MMEIKEKEKIVIARPVACRPAGFSNLKSFSKLLSGAINASAPAVIRPKTVRFKPVGNSDSIGAEVCGSADYDPPNNAPESNVMCNVVYKPIAKLVSKTTVSLLANLGDHGSIPTREIAEASTRIQPPNQFNHQTDSTSEFHRNLPPKAEQKANSINSEDDNKSLLLANSWDRLSYDSYNWRKYGQKQVKGSECPRSYYKCAYRNCPVKKKVEKTIDGQIAEIVYKGDHNHPKPQPLNHIPLDGHAQKLAAYDDATGKEVKDHLTNQQAEMVIGHEGRSENHDVNGSSIQSTFSGALPINYSGTAAACDAGPSTSNNSLGLTGECEEVSEFCSAEGDDFKSKRTKCQDQLLKASTVGEASSEPQILVLNNTDSGLIGDGFRWRKYGQKVVKGNMYPRSYYRCTNPKCNVRKYVERTSEDPGTFITTYEGRHNHAMPMKGTNTEASKRSTKNKS